MKNLFTRLNDLFLEQLIIAHKKPNNVPIKKLINPSEMRYVPR